MKKLAILFLALSPFSQAFANSWNLDILACHSIPVAADNETNLTINAYVGPTTEMRGPTFSATIQKSELAGPVTILFNSIAEQRSGGVGAPIVYSGNNFNLTVEVDAASLEDGFIYSNLVYVQNGQRYAETMACQFLR